MRTLERPGALVPAVVPAPWSFDPGIPAEMQLASSTLGADAFVLHLAGGDGQPAYLRCRLSGAGELAGEADAPGCPSLFSPGQEVRKPDPSLSVLQAVGQCVVLKVARHDDRLRFGLAWGPGTEEALQTKAERLLAAELPPLPRAAAPAAAAAERAEAGAEVPSAGAEFVNRHGAKLMAAVLALVVVVVAWGVADTPDSGDASLDQVEQLVRQLNMAGRHTEALAVCEKHGRRLDKGTAALLRGNIYHHQGEYAMAAESFRAALDKGKHPDAVKLNLASSLFHAGQVAEAEALYRDFVDTYEGKNPLLRRKAEAALETLGMMKGTLPPKNVGH